MFIIFWTLVNLVAGDINVIKTGLNWTESIQECNKKGQVILDKLCLSNDSVVKSLDGQGKIWIGEAVVNNYYWEKGCVMDVNATQEKDFSKESNLLLNCITFCQDHSSAIGLRGFKCFCMESTYAPYIPCNSSCVWESSSSCLLPNSLTRVYKAEKNSTFVQKFKNRKGGRCVTLATQDRGNNKIFWTAKNCNERNWFICQKYDNTEIEIFKEMLTWDDASLFCDSRDLVLAEISAINSKMFEDKNEDGYNFWIGLRTVNQIISKTDAIDFRQRILENCTVVDVNNNNVAYQNESCRERQYFHACVSNPHPEIHLTEKSLTEEVVTEENDIKKDVDSIDNSRNEPNNDGTKEMDIQKDVESNKESTENTSNDETSGTIVGIILGVTITILLLLTALVCLLRRFKQDGRGGYRAPQVSYSTSNRRESELPEESIDKSPSGKSKPIKPVRRSTKSKSEHAGATTYENIVLTLEDPKAISRVVSMPTKPVNNSKDNENNYDVMTRTVSPNSEGHNVYGSTETGNEYDVMDRGFRPVDNNPDYDHV